MYYLPAADKFLQRHPLLTTMLCAAFAAVFGWYTWIQQCELRSFGRAPQTLAVDRASVPTDDFAPGQWVELQGDLRFDCASTAVVSNATLENLVFGHSSETYVPATNVEARRVFVFVLDHAAFCEEAKRPPWRGVLRAASRYDLDRVRRAGFRVPAGLAQPAMRLETYGGPRETRKALAMSGFAAGLMLFGALYFWRKYHTAQIAKESNWAAHAGHS